MYATEHTGSQSPIGEPEMFIIQERIKLNIINYAGILITNILLKAVLLRKWARKLQ